MCKYTEVLTTKILEAQSRNKTSILEIVKDFTPLICKYAYRLEGEDTRSELTLFLIELVLKMPVDNFNGPNPNAQATKYIHTAIVNKAYSLYRKQQPICYDLDSLVDLPNQECPTANSELKQSIKELSPKQQTVLYARYWYGYSIQDIAQMTGTSRQSVNQVHARAIQRLKKMDLAC